jgi:hypothetical protein
VTGIFRQKNTSNTLLLLFYALVLKFNMFLHPQGPIQQPDDHYLYKWLLQFLEPLHMPAVLFAIISFLLLYSQAMLFNRVCNVLKMLPKHNYLPGMAFVLITSLFTEWSRFSAPLLINSFLIWIFYRVSMLHHSAKPGTVIFNIGLVMGVITLLYQPAIVFTALVLIALFIMRPFRIREYIVALIGVMTPYYFLALVLYLSNHWNWNQLKPVFFFKLPSMPSSVLITISIILLVLPFIMGGFYVQANLNKMLIQVRKGWSLLLVYLIISMILIAANGGDNYVNWMLCVVPLAAFHSAAYFYPAARVVPMVLQWIIFGYAIYINYWI